MQQEEDQLQDADEDEEGEEVWEGEEWGSARTSFHARTHNRSAARMKKRKRKRTILCMSLAPSGTMTTCKIGSADRLSAEMRDETDRDGQMHKYTLCAKPIFFVVR